MPLQNRVTPTNEIIAVPARGLFMGNRGCLHEATRSLRTQGWARKAWITCLLQFKGRRRQLMTPSKYTELFFLDEATALAAGHRPCAECRRADYDRFKRLWVETNASLLSGKKPSAANIDAIIHEERVTPDGTPRRWHANISELPNGTMVLVEETNTAYLIHAGHLYQWSPGGYIERTAIPAAQNVAVLTPPSLTRVLTAGYQLVLHPSV